MANQTKLEKTSHYSKSNPLKQQNKFYLNRTPIACSNENKS